MASKRRNMLHKNKKQETTEIGHWMVVGEGCGCVLGAGLVLWCGSKSSLHVVAAPLLLATYSALYYLPKIEFHRDEFSNTGFGSGLSQLSLPMYLVDCICRCGGCPGRTSHAGALLLTVIQLPRALAALLFHTCNKQKPLLCPLRLLIVRNTFPARELFQFGENLRFRGIGLPNKGLFRIVCAPYLIALQYDLRERVVARNKRSVSLQELLLEKCVGSWSEFVRPIVIFSGTVLVVVHVTTVQHFCDLRLFGVLPMPVLVVVVAVYLPLPESPVWLLVSRKKPERASAALCTLRRTPGGEPPPDNPGQQHQHVSTELLQLKKVAQSEDGVLRPLVVSCGVTLLGQFSGSDAYSFYSGWAFREARVSGGAEGAALWLSCAALAAVAASLLVHWRAGGGPTPTALLVVVGTGVALTCLFATGSLLHGMEDGGGGPVGWLPATLQLVHTCAHRGGVAAHWLVVACSAAPSPSSRLPILAACILLSTAVSHLNSLALGLLITVLHPFGVFWLHASLSAIGLVFLAMVVAPELRYTAKMADRARAEFQQLQMTPLST
ncbi:hypothetical protein AAG570_004986 [Ranatra chinensis]|uniref:Uncharacterized protein n=1 Tax=Ranatra chinensis TaxID=642074 RepID=A0ABD0XZ49_9HEMI